jgi:hypothetical protein
MDLAGSFPGVGQDESPESMWRRAPACGIEVQRAVRRRQRNRDALAAVHEYLAGPTRKFRDVH